MTHGMMKNHIPRTRDQNCNGLELCCCLHSFTDTRSHLCRFAGHTYGPWSVCKLFSFNTV